MGCAQSRVENEEAVARCKDRRQLMKEAVASRGAFASSHSAYAISLKNTGAALTDFASHQPTAAATTPPSPSPPPAPSTNAGPTPNPNSNSNPKPVPAFPPPPPPLPPDSPPSSLLPRSSTLPARPKPNHNPKPNPHTPPPPEAKPGSTWDYFFSMDDPIAVPSLVEDQNAAAPEENAQSPPPEIETVLPDPNKSGEKDDDDGTRILKHAASAGALDGWKDEATVVPRGGGVSLAEVLAKLDDHFLKASESAQDVSKLLEATRMHYHSNFVDNRGHIDHSARVMRVITWNRSFKGMSDEDGRDDFDSEKWETHATVLDKLLAWEKKLYDEVKAGELMKIEYQRKVTLLNKQKKKGANHETIEKTKAAVSHLHTRYIVDMQSMDSTESEIQRLRDGQLYPKLAELVVGMAKMWKSMHAHHESQLGAVNDLRAIDISCTPTETTGEQYKKTEQLRRTTNEWHSQFEKLVNHQRDYIHTLNNWLKLNLIPMESSLKDKVSSPPRTTSQPLPIQILLHAWDDQLEKLQDELAKSCIHSFSAVINTIILNQLEELKQKEKCEELRKEYLRKERAFNDWYHKYSTRKVESEDGDPDLGEHSHTKDPLTEKQFAMEALKKRVEEEEETHRKLCKQVREKSVTSLKTHLPELFRAMSEFTLVCSDMYNNLSSIIEAYNHPVL